MHFIDQTQILVRSGKGGRGLVSFRAGRHVPKAGADGGDGGFGGSVYLVGDRSLNTLSHLRHRHQYTAEDGAKGGANGRTGRGGQDLALKVPLGTLIYRAETNRLLGEVLAHDEHVMVAKGGKRGLGNLRFLSSTHQAPEEYTPGGAGEEFALQLELKLLADIGFAGFPNAGKSTLLSVISAARPKIADYPFTTLVPQLGVVDVDPSDLLQPKSFVAADIPGLIEGAAEGKGLGHDFLRHLERTAVIAYVIDPFTLEGMDVEYQFTQLRKELQSYSVPLGEKPGIVVITKMDLADSEFSREAISSWFADLDLKTVFVSASFQEGVHQLKRELYELIITARAQEQAELLDDSAPTGMPTAQRPKLSDYRVVETP